MKFLKIYLFTSIIVGLLQIIDGVVLASTLDIEIFSTVFSLIEMLWVPISVVAIFKVSFSKYVPVTYVVYNVLGWVYGGYLLNNSPSPELFTIPLWFAIFGLCFGVYFAIFSFLSLKQHSAKNV